MYQKNMSLFFILLLLITPSISRAGKKLTAPEGRKVIKTLKEALNKGSTTSCRKEQKSVISQELWEDIVSTLEKDKPAKGWRKIKDPSIHLSSRDKLPPGGKNGTYTFYGEGMKFMNQGVPTKIRMRARFYLHVFNKGDTTTIKRSPITKDMAFLEIKVRNPSPKELNSVNKFRIMIKDEDLIQLFKANAENEEKFGKLIKKLIENTKEIPENKKLGNMVETLFKSIYQLAIKNPAFINPVLGVSYERRGYSYIEKKYPLSKADKKKFGGNEVEYQLTVDNNVRGYLPKAKDFKKDLSFEKYFQESSKDIFGHYPINARVIEFKDPQPMSNFSLKKMSKTHQYLYKELVHKMHDPNNIIKGFIKDKGKASHFRTFFKNNPNSNIHSNIVPQDIGEGVLAGEIYSTAKIVISIKDSDSYLFAQKFTEKKNGKNMGKLELMGGRLDKGENAFTALIRELKEEDSSGELAKSILKMENNNETIKSQTIVLPFELQKIYFLDIDQTTMDKMNNSSAANKENLGFEIILKKDLANEVNSNPDRFTKKTIKILKKLHLI